MARPRIEINKTEFEKLCGLQCTLTEIAEWFSCSEDTVERWCKRTYHEGFAGTFAKKRGRGKIALRRMQFALAEKSAAMAIWLGKNWLGQVDCREDSEENAVDDPLMKLLEGLDEQAESGPDK